MQKIVGVRFKKAGKIYYFSPGEFELEKGSEVIVETTRGYEYGVVVVANKEVEDSSISQPLRTVVREATDSDRAKVADNKEKEKEALKICEEKIAHHKLPMKLVDVEYTFDVSKIIFYFTADGRIDFRELVKDLASVFRTRIELRQIGVRDEAKIMGGIGCCGRPLCCATFLGDFEPVSIRMAKEQNLSLNPTKISGICGRLMCCLKYESECYAECNMMKPAVTAPPVQGSRVMSVDGAGKVISVNNQRRTATILLDDSRTIVASWDDVVEEESTEDMPVAEKAENNDKSERRSRNSQKHRNNKNDEKHKGEKNSKKSDSNEKHRRDRRSRRRDEGESHNSKGQNISTSNHGGYNSGFAANDKEKED